MATSSNTVIDKVAISQIPMAQAVTRDSVVTGLVNGTNANMTAGQIAELVTKDSLGLDKVQNLAPNEMPISDATRAALDQKLGKTESIPQSQVTGLTTDLGNKLDKNGVIAISQVTGLEERLTVIETGDIPLTRISQFTPGVNAIIDGREDLKQQVIKGAMNW